MKTLPEEQSRVLLSAFRIGRLACVDKGEPYVVPINYVFEERSIYSHSLPGRKIDVLRAHPRACLQVDEIENDFNWRSVIAYGNFEETRVPSDRRAILGKLFAHFPMLTPVESVIAQDANAPDSIVFRIIVDRITGVGHSVPGRGQIEQAREAMSAVISEVVEMAGRESTASYLDYPGPGLC